MDIRKNHGDFEINIKIIPQEEEIINIRDLTKDELDRINHTIDPDGQIAKDGKYHNNQYRKVDGLDDFEFKLDIKSDFKN